MSDKVEQEQQQTRNQNSKNNSNKGEGKTESGEKQQKQYVKKSGENQDDNRQNKGEKSDEHYKKRDGENKKRDGENKKRDGEHKKRDGENRRDQKRDGDNTKDGENRRGQRNQDNRRKDGENQEEKTTERPKRESKYNFDRESITIETVIPTIPKESEWLKKPTYEELLQKLEKVDKEIENIRKNKNQQIQQIRDERKQKRQQEAQGREKLQPLKERIKLKIEQSNEHKKIFDEIRAEYSQVNTKFNKIKDELDAIKLKMKKPEDSARVKQAIDEIEYTLSNERVKPDQEKRLLRELQELHQTLPLCEPLEAKKKELEAIKDLRNKLKDKKDIAYDDWQDIEDELNDLKLQQKESDSAFNQPKEDLTPIIKERENEANEKINELLEKKANLRQQFEESKTKYYEQQDLIHYVKWAKRQQDNLRKRQDYEARQDQRIDDEVQYELRKQLPQEIEEPFKEEIATCAILVHYLRGLIPQQKSAEEENQKREIDVNALKKEKLEIVVSKRDKVTEDTNQKGKKGKKPQEKKTDELQKAGEKDNKTLYHNYQIVQNFESVSVAPPTTLDDLQKTIETLETKRQYFEQTREIEEKRLDEERQAKIERIRQQVTERVKLRDEEGKKRVETKGFRGADQNDDRGSRGERGNRRDNDNQDEKPQQNQPKQNTLRQQKTSTQAKMDIDDFPQIQ